MLGNCIGCGLEKNISKTGQRDGKLYGLCIECKILNEIEDVLL